MGSESETESWGSFVAIRLGMWFLILLLVVTVLWLLPSGDGGASHRTRQKLAVTERAVELEQRWKRCRAAGERLVDHPVLERLLEFRRDQAGKDVGAAGEPSVAMSPEALLAEVLSPMQDDVERKLRAASVALSDADGDWKAVSQVLASAEAKLAAIEATGSRFSKVLLDPVWAWIVGNPPNPAIRAAYLSALFQAIDELWPALAGGHEDSIAQAQARIQWLTDPTRFLEWGLLAQKTESLAKELAAAFPRPAGASGAGPGAWLESEAKVVESQIVRTGPVLDLERWRSANLRAQSCLAALARIEGTENLLKGERAELDGNVPIGAWDELEKSIQAARESLWRMDVAEAESALQAVDGSGEERRRWMSLVNRSILQRTRISRLPRQYWGDSVSVAVARFDAAVTNNSIGVERFEEELKLHQETLTAAENAWIKDEEESLPRQLEQGIAGAVARWDQMQEYFGEDERLRRIRASIASLAPKPEPVDTVDAGGMVPKGKDEDESKDSDIPPVAPPVSESGSVYSGRFNGRKKLPPELETSVRMGLEWLRKHQDPDGRWDADGFMKHDKEGVPCDGPGNGVHDVGVTGLALLAMLGDGNTPFRGSYRESVQLGVAWLQRQQDPKTGIFGSYESHDFIYGHAIATCAMVEAYGLSRSVDLRQSAQLGIDYLERHRNPFGVWRYQPRDNDNDTSVTGWCVMAYESGKNFGLQVNDAALVQCATWFDQVTDSSGRAGYSKVGEPSARHPGDHGTRFPVERGEAMTAVGLYCRFLLGQDPKRKQVMNAAADLILSKPPIWDPMNGTIDHYYWYYASHALFQMGGRHWLTWSGKLTQAVVRSQRMDGNFSGSWDPFCAWGEDGGRIYSTAMLVLTLEAHYRHGKLVPGK